MSNGSHREKVEHRRRKVKIKGARKRAKQALHAQAQRKARRRPAGA